MTPPEFLEPDVVLFLHDQALREYGGVQGVKNEDLLHSALGRPVNQQVYAEPGMVDLCQLAAAYAYGLASNHAFHDGNKRTAWSSCVLFLKLNGAEVVASAEDVIEQVVRLACGQLTEAEFATWLRSCCSLPERR